MLVLLVLACDSGVIETKEAPTRAAPAAAQTCPVCGGPLDKDRAITASAADGNVLVCSQGCAIRYAVSKAPPPADSRPAEDPESRPNQGR